MGFKAYVKHPLSLTCKHGNSLSLQQQELSCSIAKQTPVLLPSETPFQPIELSPKLKDIKHFINWSPCLSAGQVLLV